MNCVRETLNGAPRYHAGLVRFHMLHDIVVKPMGTSIPEALEPPLLLAIVIEKRKWNIQSTIKRIRLEKHVSKTAQGAQSCGISNA